MPKETWQENGPTKQRLRQFRRFGAPKPPAISFQVSCTKAAASAMTRATSFAAAMAATRRADEEPVFFSKDSKVW